VKLITSDHHCGLRAARLAVFPGGAWQRCQFHLQQNASQYVVRLEQRPEVAADLRSVFNAPNREEAERLLVAMEKKYRQSSPRLSA
jgi:transposase-like protein